MFPIFDSLKGIVKPPVIITDNNIFRLHYKFTVVCLVAFSLLVTSKQYFGDPIDCINNDDIPADVLKTFCWIHATFSLPAAFGKEVGVEVPYPGVDKSIAGEDRVYHKYYQWVCFVLFLQSIFFYLPRFMWKMWEGNRMKNLVLGLNSPVMEAADKKKNMGLLAEYLKSHMRQHTGYVTSYILCEILNLANVIGQIYLVDRFLGGEFTKFGIKVLKYSETDQEFRDDPMVRVFPRMTKCTFHRYGPSGDVQRHDAFCILSLNIINEKIYIFLWFWFVVLAVLSGLVVLYRLLTILFPRLRYTMLRSRARLTEEHILRSVHERTGLGDWFVLYLLSKNIDPLNMRELMRTLFSTLEERPRLLNDKEAEATA